MDNSTSFKYKSSFFEPLVAADNGVLKTFKIAVPLKCFSNFWRSLEMLVINCKIHPELNWIKRCLFQKKIIADTKKELDCVFIIITPDGENVHIFKEINKIHNHIKKLNKKSLIGDLSKNC